MLVPPPGATGIRLLAAEGLLDPSLMAAHCVYADPEEIALLAANGVGVAHCPRSNGYLGGGVAPVEELLAAGGRFGRHRQPCLDALARPVRGGRTAIVAASTGRAARCTVIARALELATLGGARVLGMDDQISSLVPGKQADLTVLSLVNSVRPRGRSCYGGRPGRLPDRVTATLVAGELHYLKGTSRWPDSTRAARSARSRMLP
jgi:cytosine/adenosine deaminase-related metal-dependent hydrolase